MPYTFPRLPTAFSSRFLISSLLLTGCLSSSAFASTQDSNTISPRNFGASVTGLFSNQSIGYGDAMIPLWGRNTNFFYIDPQIIFHDSNEYAGSLGFGKRWLQSEKAGVLGAYVFADYNHSPRGNGFWYVSPGVERLGQIVDFSANLYVPVSNQTIDTGTYYANQLGIYDYVRFQGNSQYDQLFATHESVGIGGDAEIGFRIPFPNNPKIYFGGYYFNPKDANTIHGATARLDVPLNNRLTLSLSDGYDNVAHNTVKVGLTYNFGARHNSFDFKGDLADRMLDPVHRHLASVTGAATTGTPVSTVYTPTGKEGQEYSNITFFNNSSNPSIQDGTFEHPYIDFNQGNVDSANKIGNTLLYVNTGTYASNSTITLTNDSIWGRQTYNGTVFAKPAEGDNRPLFDFSGMPNIIPPSGNTPGILINQNGADVTVDSIRLVGNPNNFAQAGVQIINTSGKPVNTTINNVDGGEFNVGAIVNNNGAIDTLTISNSTFHDSVNFGDGVDIYTSGTIGTIAIGSSQFNNNDRSGMSILVQNNGVVDNINVKDSNFNGNGLGQGIPISSGLLISTQYNTGVPGNAPTVLNTTIDNSTFNGNYYGLQTLNVDGNGGNYTINNSTFNNNQYGMQITNRAPNRSGASIGDITITGTTIDGNSATGINIQNGTNGANPNTRTMGQVTIANSIITGNTTGISIQNYSTITGISVNGSTIDNNGTGILVNNSGTIGLDNTIIVDKIGNNNTTSASCNGANITDANGNPVCMSIK